MMSENFAIQEATLCLPAELVHLPTFLEHARRMAEVAGVADAQITRLELAVERERVYPAMTRPAVSGAKVDRAYIAILNRSWMYVGLARSA